MLCQIACRRENLRLVVHLAGRLCKAQVADLLEVCAPAVRPIVELDELLSADAAGIDALLRLEQQGARLVGLPGYSRPEVEILARQRGR